MNTKSVIVVAVAAVASAFASTSLASEAGAKAPSQQSRFAACAHESKGLHGEEHQKFMSECLKAEGESHAKDAVRKTAGEPGHQQHRMKACNDEAHEKELHGDERRAFMSNCLKG